MAMVQMKESTLLEKNYSSVSWSSHNLHRLSTWELVYVLVVKQTRSTSVDNSRPQNSRESFPCGHETHAECHHGPYGELPRQLLGVAQLFEACRLGAQSAVLAAVDILTKGLLAFVIRVIARYLLDLRHCKGVTMATKGIGTLSPWTHSIIVRFNKRNDKVIYDLVKYFSYLIITFPDRLYISTV